MFLTKKGRLNVFVTHTSIQGSMFDSQGGRNKFRNFMTSTASLVINLFAEMNAQLVGSSSEKRKCVLLKISVSCRRNPLTSAFPSS